MFQQITETLSVLLLQKMGNEVVGFQNALIRVSYGTAHVSVGKHWSFQVTTPGANMGHLKKMQNIVSRVVQSLETMVYRKKNPKNWDHIAQKRVEERRFCTGCSKKGVFWLFSMFTKARRKNKELNFQKWRYQADKRKTFHVFFKANREESAKRL